MKKIFKTIDLFAGIGGLRIGFDNAGFKTVYANDFDAYCKITYDLNFKETKLDCDDIWNVVNKNLPQFDLLLGGFPCQAFSIAGSRQGFNDKKGRGNLFFALANLIDKYKPQAFLLENVKNLASHDNGKTFEIILTTLKDLNYYVDYKILNTMEYGNIPQNRERLYIVGFKNLRHFNNFRFPYPVQLKTEVNHILEDNVDQKYYYDNKPLMEKLKNYKFERGKVYQWRRKYVRENKSGVCPTLTANMGQGGHNVPIIRDTKGIRKLTPKECLRLQGFPRWYKLPKEVNDSRLYMQIGNSVSVPVVRRVANNIRLALQESRLIKRENFQKEPLNYLQA